jgi:peptide subunit release factor 1 (eRF1)
MEKRHNYMRKVAEVAVTLFIDSANNKCNCQGLIMAG